MKTLFAIITATVAAVTALAETSRTATENWTRKRIAAATNETLRLANAYTDAHGGGGLDTNAVEMIANEAVRTNEVTVALVTATNDLTEAVRRLSPPTKDDIENALGWRVVALGDGAGIQFGGGEPVPAERDRYEAILGYRIRMRDDGTPTIEFEL